MIISHKHQFIFIKTRKTAGTSIEAYLRQFLGKNDVAYPCGEFKGQNLQKSYNPFIDGAFWFRYFTITRRPIYLKSVIKSLFGSCIDYEHLPAISVKSRVQNEVWNSYFKFCFERDPINKIISHFKHRTRAYNPNLLWEDYMSKEDFPYNYPFYTDFSGNIIVDYIGKYENIDAEMEYICNRIGIPYHGLPKKNISKDRDRTDYKDFYNTKQRSEVEKKFIREVDIINTKRGKIR